MTIEQGKIDFTPIAEQFEFQGDVMDVVPFGSGHIHDTYLVKTLDKFTPDYILQKINHKIFTNVDGLMSNISLVTSHLKSKLHSQEQTDSQFQTVELVNSVKGEPFIKISGSYWRAFVFIDDSFTYQKIQNSTQAYEAGKIIGEFQNQLSDIKTELEVTITGFHDLEFRMDQFNLAVKNDFKNRVSSIDDEIRFVEETTKQLEPFLDIIKSEKVPLRITHNDTKLNNILFDKGDKAICLIDLDTVMPGYVFYDFGDAIRTMANEADEDEKDLKRVKFSKEIYQSFREGYMEAASPFLTSLEKQWLFASPIYITFIMGLRFLTDLLNGDVYFKTQYRDHNLVRAKCQFELVSKMKDGLS